jgi:hypothetical protein
MDFITFVLTLFIGFANGDNIVWGTSVEHIEQSTAAILE